MQRFLSGVVCAVIMATVLAHDGHEHLDQMPLDYVKYPYQAMYPGDNEGNQLCTKNTMYFLLMLNSNCRFDFFGHHNLRTFALAAMSHQG